MIDITLPEIGEGVTEATIVSWLVKPGEAVHAGTPIVEIMTDKVNMEIEAEAAGTMAEIVVPVDEEVRVGAVICRIDPKAAGGQ
ncbi:MAG: biotin/lipoyl-containing protein [Pseudomonadota bacterium]